MEWQDLAGVTISVFFITYLLGSAIFTAIILLSIVNSR